MPISKYRMVFCGYQGVHARFKDRLEKVKFGVPMACAFQSGDIPGPLLILLLKVNKEGPLRKDIWRAPGNQAQVKKIAAIMKGGRMMNISDINVYTAASIVKRFLSKLPGGVFGPENERLLFGILHEPDPTKQRAVFAKIIHAMDPVSQNFMVLLFGTFRIIADSSITFDTRMNPEAIGISVAPSLFHTCINDTKAKFDDVRKFKQASHIIAILINNFGYTDMFSRESYEYYAKITGRTIRVEENWMFSFQYPIKKRIGRRQNLGTSLGALNIHQNDLECESSDDNTTLPIAKRSTSASVVLNRSAIGAASVTGCVDPHHQPCCSCASAEKPLSLIFGIIVKRPSLEMEKADLVNTCINRETENDDDNELCDLGSNISLHSGVFRYNNNKFSNNISKDSHSHQNIIPTRCYCGPSSIKDSINCKCDSTMYNSNINKELLSSRISASLNEGIDMPKYLLGFDRIVREDIASENSRSLQNLEYVHALQKGRMKNRSQWFLDGNTNGNDKSDEGKPNKANIFNENGINNVKTNNDTSIAANNNIEDDQELINGETSKAIKKFNKKTLLAKTLSDKPILLPSLCNSTSGIERRSSWKRHYFRAQKSLDLSIESNNNTDKVLSSRDDKPIRRISTLTGFMRSTTNEDDNQSKSNKTKLVRRKSSSSMKNKSPSYYSTSKLVLTKN